MKENIHELLKQKFHYLMNEEKIYLQAGLTLEKMAMLLDTNRTYTSNFVNPQIRSESVCSNQFNCYACVRHQIEANDALVMPL